MKTDGTNILGTGVDIVETARIRDSLDRVAMMVKGPGIINQIDEDIVI